MNLDGVKVFFTKKICFRCEMLPFVSQKPVKKCYQTLMRKITYQTFFDFNIKYVPGFVNYSTIMVKKNKLILLNAFLKKHSLACQS